jgi:hypothetical protein
MSGDPTYLRNLKQYARVQYGTSADANATVEDLDKESDRGAIILAATSIEDTLEYAIGGRHMKVLETDAEARAAVFGAEGTISTYANKTLIAYALGLIDKKAARILTLCATFEMPALIPANRWLLKCLSLRTPLRLQLGRHS